MTCIVGIVDGQRVVMGGDSAGVADLDLTVRADQKIFTKDEFVMGFTSSFRMGQLLRYKLAPPKIHDTELAEYMATSFIDSVRDTLKSGGFATKNQDAERGGTFLVGIRGRLFTISCDYQVGESLAGYDAVGCGSSYAIGAIYAAKESCAEDKVQVALKAAETFSAGVRGPFVIKAVPK